VLSLAGSDGAARLAAGSFRDMTRVAGADPEQWSAIFRMNAAPLAQAASRLQARFRELMRKNYPPSELKKVKSLRMKMEKLSSLNKEKR
jgi:prephenate dehydrogenase